jgi:DUF4097 and DUF4098 domain-containing protein YvlB
MKSIIYQLPAILGLLCSTLIFGQTESISVPLSAPGKYFTLDVNIVNGSISVTTYTGQDIQIDITSQKINDEYPNVSKDGMKQISSPRGYDITATENNNAVFIRNKNPMSNVSINLKIPQQSGTIKLRTISSGDIKIENVKGDIEINNVNGAISANNISGSLVASTINGYIHADFVSVDPEAAMAYSTLNGNIDLVLPSDIKANIKMKSSMGSMFSDFDLVIDKNQPSVKRSNQPGMFKLEIEDWVYAKINGGGPEIMMNNMTGDIMVKKRK